MVRELTKSKTKIWGNFKGAVKYKSSLTNK